MTETTTEAVPMGIGAEAPTVIEAAPRRGPGRPKKVKPGDDVGAELLRQPAVGMPCQFTQDNGSVVAAILTGRSRTDDSSWNLKLFLDGPSVPSSRAGVRQAATPTPGYFNLID
jgi:hypothetical protein